MLFLVEGIGYRMMVSGAGCVDLLDLCERAVDALIELVSVEDLLIPLEHMDTQRLSQPWIKFSATDSATESPKALSLFEVKSRAFSRVLLRFFSLGDPSEEPIPESTGD